ncbi:Tetrathionate reductase subunit B precursor [Planctomycetes bacterium Pan216]|uniref:Tetrathionate reductase subunit B n=1 Tax=Kolteria novifilia TaxID=2527975 RepID=A0A518B1L1_9BACT|nr:Tetrathionate reductase subunit B precursor [Planctomycetes bacterium Pan216]
MTHDSRLPVIDLPTEATATTGRDYWRSLDDLAETPEFQEFLRREFPTQAVEVERGAVPRRRFVQLMAASFGLAGMATGCRRPEIEILPYAKMPETVVPGLPTFYASSIPGTFVQAPVLVESHQGRPTKIEGNPKHPASLGATDAFTQAAVLDLYDPDRSRDVLRDGAVSSWQEFDDFLAKRSAKLLENQGEGLRILSDRRRSPSLDLVRQRLLEKAPKARWHRYETLEDEDALEASEVLFGKPLRPRHDLAAADVILALDVDFLGVDSEAVTNVRQFTSRRRPENTTETDDQHHDAGTDDQHHDAGTDDQHHDAGTDDQHHDAKSMNRLYVVENTFTATGSMADHRLRLPAGQIIHYVMALANELDAWDIVGIDRLWGREQVEAKPLPTDWVKEVAADLRAHEGHSLVITGRRQPASVHALVNLLNLALGNVGKTVTFIDAPKADEGSLAELVGDIKSKKVDTLVMLGGNPAYDAPVDLDFKEALSLVPNSIRLGVSVNETSAGCSWHLPEAHWLEAWGDSESPDGTYAPVQPLIAPLFDGRTPLEIVARLAGDKRSLSYDLVREAFKARTGEGGDKAFRRFLHEGVWEGTAAKPITPRLSSNAAVMVTTLLRSDRRRLSGGYELSFHGDSSVLDGRFANNGWLQEAPDPMTKLTWDNAALVSPQTARELGVRTGDVVELTLDGRVTEAPVFLLPGQADGSVSVALGYGRRRAGRVGDGVGFDAYPLRTSTEPYFAGGLEIKRTGKRYAFATTQDHGSMEGRDLVRETIVGAESDHDSHEMEHHDDHAGEEKAAVDHRHDHEHAQGHGSGHEAADPLNIVTPPALDGDHQWGMVVNLSACVGCNACVIACQSENNVPIVGKEQIAVGREMHWLRIDRYFKGEPDEPEVVHQPVACMHCENAPCEIVCPVNATVHSPEGLNLQVYNRCIGTRYCGNNCPYKVRRFNWFDFNERPLNELYLGPLGDSGMPETEKMGKNPDVTVRMRGVMEKCTYCVQRIEKAKSGAKLSGQPLKDGMVTPACGQACAADAIVFGDLSDPESRISKLREDPSHYGLLEEINTRPRTTYLARARNPNTALLRSERGEGSEEKGEGEK